MTQEKIFYCPQFPVSKVFNDGHELWIEMPQTARYQWGFLPALAENISLVGCDPIRCYENPDGIILGLSGVNRYQAILTLGWTHFPAFFFANDSTIPAKYVSDYQEISAETAKSMVKNRPCTVINEVNGYSYQHHFSPIDFLVNFTSSESTRQRMFVCFFIENVANQCWGHTFDDLRKQLDLAKSKYNLIPAFANICEWVLQQKTNATPPNS